MNRHILLGDVHGCFDELMELLDRVRLTDDDVVVSVGDLVDRGPDSPRVVDWFRARGGKAVVLMGNHERKHVRGILSYAQEIVRLQFGHRYADAVAWMRGLPYFLELPEAIVVHAALVPGVPLAEQREDVLAGTAAGERALAAALGEQAWHEVYAGPKPVVFGHHVVGREPLVTRHAYGLDTGACHGGRLTALVLPSFERVSVDARADHWAQEKLRWQQPVLRARDWLDMAFAKARRELEPWADERGPWLEALRAWLASLEGLPPVLRERLLALSPGLSAEALDAHPEKGLLHLARRGRLDLSVVQQRCATPRRTLDLAGLLGVPHPPFPA